MYTLKYCDWFYYYKDSTFWFIFQVFTRAIYVHYLHFLIAHAFSKQDFVFIPLNRTLFMLLSSSLSSQSSFYPAQLATPSFFKHFLCFKSRVPHSFGFLLTSLATPSQNLSQPFPFLPSSNLRVRQSPSLQRMDSHDSWPDDFQIFIFRVDISNKFQLPILHLYRVTNISIDLRSPSPCQKQQQKLPPQ